MRPLFVDTWYLIALFDPADADHRRAAAIRRRVSDRQFVTHEGVFMEFLAFFAEWGPTVRKRAIGAVRELSEEAEVIRASDLYAAALALYAARLDKEYSLVDCMSMVLMEQRGITHVLTNDHHFAQAGFTVVNE